ncbi:MAG: copper-binding protein [Burkholderiales bacterium]|nr:copper-binding protein [Burkholderiales bacterium]
MKISKHLFSLFLVIFVACFAAVHAQEKHNMADGEIKKVNRENKKMTIKHGDIKSLDMPGMTMVFQIRDISLFETFKAGDKVKFVAEKLDGAFVVTNMQLAD